MTRRHRLALASAAVVAGALLTPAHASAHGHGKVAVHLGDYYGYGFGAHYGLGWGWGWGWGPGVWPPSGPYALPPQGGVDRGLALHSQPPGRQPGKVGPPAGPARPPV